MNRCAIAIHGGAGTISRMSLDPDREAAYRVALERAARIGHDVLARGGASVEAVCAAVTDLEDDALFNAGRGAVFNADGEIEMDAAVMDGSRCRAGAVTGVKRIRNPVLAARAVMEKTPYVMLGRDGAEALALAQGLPMVTADYFFTPNRWQALQREKARRAAGAVTPVSDEDRHGTVGAVALDRAGNLAAATSTGGHTHKMAGRIGDTPIIGAGTYAENATCAVSATGDGEYFICLAVAHEIASRMRYLNESLADTASHVVMKTLADAGGTGGLVAIDRLGNVTMPFNTEGMYRASIGVDGRLTVGIHRST